MCVEDPFLHIFQLHTDQEIYASKGIVTNLGYDWDKLLGPVLFAYQRWYIPPQ